MREKLQNLHNVVKIWHFIVIFLITAPLSAWLLRQNNLQMLQLRDEVLRIDKETGNITETEPALIELGDFVLNHMNTNMGSPVELQGAYNAAVERARQKAETSGSVNSAVYAEAQLRCEDPNVLLTVRAQCIQDYVTQNAVPGSDPQELEFPDKALYSYNFTSPKWSPDLAGFTLLTAFLSFLSIILLTITRVIGPAIGRWIDNDPLE